MSRRWVLHQLSHPQETLGVDTSVELLMLVDQYFELQFKGIATGDESWDRYLIESPSMFAGRREEVIPGPNQECRSAKLR
jgi:hypothetical protein